jgi:hypothetical protein
MPLTSIWKGNELTCRKCRLLVQFIPAHLFSFSMMFCLQVCTELSAQATGVLIIFSLSVDAHTAHHLYYECLKGDLMKNRTVILVSHHVQLTAPGASYIVALDNGRLQFQGSQADFMTSKVLQSLSQSGATDAADESEEAKVPDVEDIAAGETTLDNSADKSDTNSTAAPTAVDVEVKLEQKKAPRKLIEEEKRAVGRIGKDIWMTYLSACGGTMYWITFGFALVVAAAGPVLQNGWLKYESAL